MQTFSLKLKFSLVMSAGALALVIGIGAISARFAEQDLMATLSSQQSGLVSRVADDLDARLTLATEALSASAAALPKDVASDPASADASRVAPPALLQWFDQILILDAHGVVTAASPRTGTPVVGVDLSDRRYVQRAMASGKPVISDPLRGKVTGLPRMTIAAPVVDDAGKVVSVMVGVLSPTGRNAFGNVLGDLSTTRVGETGWFAVVTTDPDPIYLAHPDPARRMQPVGHGRSPAMEKVVKAKAPDTFFGTLEDGRAALVSYRPLKTSGWVLAAILPEAEAFSAVKRARERTIVIGGIAALLVLPIVWLVAWGLLRPLSVLRRRVEAIAGDPDCEALTPVGRDEVGQVAAAFDALVAGQRRAEASRVASDRDRRRLVAILESSSDLVTMTDLKGRVVYLNAAGRTACGKALNEDLSDTTMHDYFPKWVIDKLEHEAIPTALANGTWVGESAVLGRNGREIPADHTVTAHRNVNGDLEFFSSLLHDTSVAQSAAARVQSSEARMLSIADALPVLVSFIDRDYRYHFVNSRYEDHFGIDKSQVIGRTVAELIGQKAYEKYLPFLQRAASGETQIFEIESEAGARPMHFLVKLIPQFDDDRNVMGFHFIHQDVTDHKVEHQRLSQLVHRDTLTGLLNRAGFEVAIEEAMQRSRNHQSAMALFYLDVDRFKAINDRHGHPIGDKLLRAFASRLLGALRSADVAARLGGDEFVVIAEGLRNTEDVRAIAKKILRAMRQDFELGGTTLAITATIGVAAYTGGPMKAEELIQRADVALYRAKNAGRNRYDLDDPARALVLGSIESSEALELTAIL